MATFKYVSLIPQQCEICESRSDLLCCSGCRVAFYCSLDHQNAHMKIHQHACTTVEKAHQNVSEDNTSLRDRMSPAWPRVFEDYAGRYGPHYASILDTRRSNYTRARFRFVDTILGHFPRHRVAVQTALDHLLHMLRRNRLDNQGLRDMVPSLMLRLGRNQDAYHFVKSWAICGPDGKYGRDNMELLPSLDTNAADVFEDPWWWTGTFLNLSHASVVMLIKVRALLDLRNLQNMTRALRASTLPFELFNQVRGDLLGDSSLAGRRDIATADTATLGAMIERTMKQVWALYLAVEEKNVHYWPLLLSMHHGGERYRCSVYHFTGSPEDSHYIMDSHLIMGYNYPAWEETLGALDEIHAVWTIRRDQVPAAHKDGFFDEEGHCSEDYF